MKKEKKEKHFIRRPVYPGGPKAMRELIRQHLQYPEEASRNGIEGTVALRYEIDYKGNVTDVQVLSGLGYGCDEEAVRLVRLLKFDVPTARGLKVTFHNTLKVHFRMPKAAQPAQTAQGIRYNYVPSPTQQKEDEGQNPPKEPGSGYSYTITFGG